jgi:hypothetical protein
MNIVEYLNQTDFNENGFRLCPRITCVDGFSLSVQAGEFNYCTPRINSDNYLSVEVGFPSEKDDDLMEYAENPETPTETVYGYVPVDVVERVIEKHGGMNCHHIDKLAQELAEAADDSAPGCYGL